MTRKRSKPGTRQLSGQSGDGYEVGYGKPPSHTQFKPGQSGNPRGRPRGSKNLATLIDEELSSKVAVREGGKRRTLSKRAVIAKKFVNKAAEGDIRTLQTLFKVQDSAPAEPDAIAANEDEKKSLGPDDRAILQAYESKLRQRLEQAGADVKQPRKGRRK